MNSNVQILLILGCLFLTVSSSPRNSLTCELCVDIVTDLDEWITSDKTEQEIVDFAKEVRILLSWCCCCVAKLSLNSTQLQLQL